MQMNGGYNAGYNRPYVVEEVYVTGTPRGYYQQPLITAPQPQVVIVE